MKTAEEVISRIMWDDNLPSDDFIVGYIDRFKGKYHVRLWGVITLLHL